jgi:hypothetical protein
MTNQNQERRNGASFYRLDYRGDTITIRILENTYPMVVELYDKTTLEWVEMKMMSMESDGQIQLTRPSQSLRNISSILNEHSSTGKEQSSSRAATVSNEQSREMNEKRKRSGSFAHDRGGELFSSNDGNALNVPIPKKQKQSLVVNQLPIDQKVPRLESTVARSTPNYQVPLPMNPLIPPLLPEEEIRAVISYMKDRLLTKLTGISEEQLHLSLDLEKLAHLKHVDKKYILTIFMDNVLLKDCNSITQEKFDKILKFLAGTMQLNPGQDSTERILLHEDIDKETYHFFQLYFEMNHEKQTWRRVPVQIPFEQIIADVQSKVLKLEQGSSSAGKKKVVFDNKRSECALSNDMRMNGKHYLILEKVQKAKENATFLKNFLHNDCKLQQVDKVKILYHRKSPPGMGFIHFTCPLLSKEEVASGNYLQYLKQEEVISKIISLARARFNRNLNCRPLDSEDIYHFMKIKKTKQLTIEEPNGYSLQAQQVSIQQFGQAKVDLFKSAPIGAIKAYTYPRYKIFPTIIQRFNTEIDVLKPLNQIYIIDFQCAVAQTEDGSIPLEIAVVNLSLDDGKNLKEFHYLINPGTIPSSYKSTYEYTQNNIHKIEPQLGFDDLRKLWTEFLNFMGINSAKDAKHCILVCKDRNSQVNNDCIRWLYKKTVADYQQRDVNQSYSFYFDHVQTHNIIMDLSQFLEMYMPKLSPEDIRSSNLKILNHLNQESKCLIHQTLQVQYKCALEEVRAIAGMLTFCIKSDWKYLCNVS